MQSGWRWLTRGGTGWLVSRTFWTRLVLIEFLQALHPNEKSFRPSHRSSVHGAILHDASYYSLIELQGPQHILKRLLEFCCEPGANPASVRYLNGARVCDTHIYGSESYPFDLISPVTVIWQPAQTEVATPDPTLVTASDQSTAEKSDSLKRKRKKKAKGEENASDPLAEEQEARRVVWVRCHPSGYNDVYTSLQHSASFALEFYKKPVNGGKTHTVDILDRRHLVNVFEIMGPKSSQVIRGALTPVSEDKRTEFREV
jgi:ribonuclease P/MRP protein subunit POP1